MSVQDAVRTVAVPRQAGAPTAEQAAAPVERPHRSNAWTAEEKQFAVVLSLMFAVLGVVITVAMVMAQDVWS